MQYIKIIRAKNEFTPELSRESFIDFTYSHLRRFGDSKELINKSIDYAFSKTVSRGGFLLASYMDNILVGTQVVNKTGMSEYIPENIIVYLAVHINFFNQGIGKGLIKKAFELKSKQAVAIDIADMISELIPIQN